MASKSPISSSKNGTQDCFRHHSDRTKGLHNPSSSSASERVPGRTAPGASPAPPVVPYVWSRNNVQPLELGYFPGHSLPANASHPAPGSRNASSLGDFGGSVYHVGSTRPAVTFESEFGERGRTQSWASLETALQTLHRTAKVFPPLRSAVGTLISSLDIVQEAARHRQDYAKLALDLRDLTLELQKHLQSGPTSMSDCVANIVRSIEAEVGFLSKKKAQGLAKGMIRASKDAEELVQSYRRIDRLFRRLQTDASLGAWSIAHEHLANVRLEGILPVKLASYDAVLPAGIMRRKCTEGTRTNILSGLDNWSCDPAEANVYCMSGMAGTGKTTIACSLSEALEKRKQLAASFFCTRSLPDSNDVGRIVPTLAYQFARYSRPFQSALCRVLESDPDIGSRWIPLQCERLLKEPLWAIRSAMPDNIVVVLDALDECNDANGVDTLLNEVFRLAEEFSIKFFITSRPEHRVSDKILSKGNSARSVFHLHEVEESVVQADIELYLLEELEIMSPSEVEIKQLAQLAGNLFIFAATVIRYIRPGDLNTAVDSQERLRAVLSVESKSRRQYAELDVLYRAILEPILNEESLEIQEIERVQLVLWTAVCVREPVTSETLAVLAGLCDRKTRAILQSLRSVLRISETNNLVFPLHASFAEFIFSQERSQKCFCDKQGHAHFLVQQCFRAMRDELRFNICELESSLVLDEEVRGLEQRVAKNISLTLSYACRHWGDHLLLAAPTAELYAMLEEFLSNQLLFWMEVLNLSKCMSIGVLALERVQLWLRASDASPDLAKLVSDAHDFVALFRANTVSLATPHIYISALPFCHKSSLVFKRHWSCMRGLIDVGGTAIEHSGSAALASWSIDESVNSIALSPDGSLIAFGSGQCLSKQNVGLGRIGVINRHSGAVVISPFEGHAGSVTSVTFSPDGTCIASGSNDSTICVWSAKDGKQVVGPFNGHKSSINSVGYSPDGAHIISGSSDMTICVWNAHTGSLVTGPLKGHMSGINSVTFSPDGTCIASAASDNTIRVWNSQDGRCVVGPVEGHTKSVHCIAYSPNGTCIVSASRDETIRIWSARDGRCIAGPFKGHTGPVNCVAFSPDGMSIVSGSSDDTLRVWDVENNRCISSPLRGHTSSVYSVAFSSDSMRIVSGSRDQTISVWSNQANTHVVGLFKGHTKLVNCVAFSPNGSLIASGSLDNTVCVWNAQDGRVVVGPFEGHTGLVNSVTFSPEGDRIASGSCDKTIRIWRVQDGACMAGPFEGHIKTVHSVAFSPNGKFVASGSSDSTIRVWNAKDGECVAGPFAGHTDSVYSVAFSPSGGHIISGSYDGTIRVWDARDGGCIVGPFGTHAKSVHCVAYSPDGAHIASGSADKTVCIWDAENGGLIAGPFKGHADSVSSVSFSPDGKFVASGSYDNTVCVWSVHNGTLAAGPFKCHSKAVYCVAYSPDGTCVVSCSRDCSIRILALQEAKALVPALNGEWQFRSSGWVVNQSGERLFWAPRHLRPLLPQSYQLCAIGSEGSLTLDYTAIQIGENWSRSYVRQ